MHLTNLSTCNQHHDLPCLHVHVCCTLFDLLHTALPLFFSSLYSPSLYIPSFLFVSLVEHTTCFSEAAYLDAAARLRTFLTRWVEVLDARVAAAMLGSYGRVEELMHLAGLRGDYEALLEYLVHKVGGRLDWCWTGC